MRVRMKMVMVRNAWTSQGGPIMIPRVTKLVVPLVILTIGGVATSQVFDSVVYTASFNSPPESGGIHFLDMAQGKVTTQYAFPERNRGGIMGPDGRAYIGLWISNAVASVDPATGALVDIVKDGSNSILGAPYQLAPNHENVGGFGICCIDGNSAPAPAPANQRNTALVDFATKTFAFDGWFPNTELDQAGFFPNLFKPGTFVGVPRSSGDLAINEYPLAQTPPQALVLTTLVSLPSAGYFGCCWAEDGNIYVWGNQYVGMHVVDIRAHASTVVAVSGVYAPMFACLWAAPWEKPGMRAYLSGSDYTVYSLDLMARPIIATKTTAVLKAPVMDFPIGACNAEDCQLCTWWSGAAKPGQRNFHLNFGQAHAGEVAVLVPSVSGLRPVPAVLNGLEIYLLLDSASLAGLNGFLPYAAVSVLDGTGQADVTWRGLGAKLGVSAYWQAYTFGAGGTTAATNIIHVNM